MEATTDQLRFFARRGGGAKQAVELNDVVRSAWELLPAVGVAFEVRGDVFNVEADRHRLEQVLINVLRNAVNSGAESVVVHVGQAGKMAVVQVEDNGAGLQGMDLNDMFDDGMGLGLSISAEIINQHGGQIWAEENDEHGLSVYIHLPLMEEDT